MGFRDARINEANEKAKKSTEILEAYVLHALCALATERKATLVAPLGSKIFAPKYGRNGSDLVSPTWNGHKIEAELHFLAASSYTSEINPERFKIEIGRYSRKVRIFSKKGCVDHVEVAKAIADEVAAEIADQSYEDKAEGARIKGDSVAKVINEKHGVRFSKDPLYANHPAFGVSSVKRAEKTDDVAKLRYVLTLADDKISIDDAIQLLNKARACGVSKIAKISFFTMREEVADGVLGAVYALGLGKSKDSPATSDEIGDRR